MRILEGLGAVVLAVGLMVWSYKVRPRPDYDKVNARRARQGKPPLDPS